MIVTTDPGLSALIYGPSVQTPPFVPGPAEPIVITSEIPVFHASTTVLSPVWIALAIVAIYLIARRR